MSLFSSERVVTVSGGVSRLREDTYIRNTTGIVIAGAIQSNSSISDTLLIDAVSGTIGSVKAFNRRCKNQSYIGYPKSSFKYSDIKKDDLIVELNKQLKLTGTNKLTASAVADSDISIILMDKEFHVKYVLENHKSYIRSTNTLVHNSINYYYNSSSDIGNYFFGVQTGYTINASRTYTLTTTINTAYSVIYNPAQAAVYQMIDSVNTLISPAVAESWTVTTLVTTTLAYSNYLPTNTINPTTQTTTSSSYTTGSNPGSFTNTVVTSTQVITDSVSFNLNKPNNYTNSNLYRRPPNKEIVTGTGEGGNGYYGELTQTVYYWVIYYTQNGVRKSTFFKFTGGIFQEYEYTLPVDKYNTFAPIVPIRDNKIAFKASYTNMNDKNTVRVAKYKQAKKVLKLLGITPEMLNKEIDKLNTTISKQSDGDSGIEDVYVTLFSNLDSKYIDPKTNTVKFHVDQLAYNYAFFNYFYETTSQINLPTVLPFGGLNNYNKLIVNKAGTFKNEITWSYLTKTLKIGKLDKDYTFTLKQTPPPELDENESYGMMFGLYNMGCDYTIRKQNTKLVDTDPDTYYEILVTNFNSRYIVSASENDIASYTVNVRNVSNSPSKKAIESRKQIVIPFSFGLLNKVPNKYRETLIARSLHLGLFTKTVQEIPWYQQDWFLPVIVVVAIYTGQLEAISLAFETAVTTVYFALGTVTYGVATLITLALYAITNVALKSLMTKAFGSNSILGQLVAIVASVYVGNGFSFDSISFTSILSTAKSVMQAQLEGKIEEYTDIAQKFEANQDKYEEIFDELEAITSKRELAEQTFEIYNFFVKHTQEFINFKDLVSEEFAGNINTQLSMISNFSSNAVKLLDPATLIIESRDLLD